MVGPLWRVVRMWQKSTILACLVALVAGLVLAAPAEAAKRKPKRWLPPHDSTSFNYPLSPRLTDRFRIRNQIRTAVLHARPGSSIRMVTFTFEDWNLQRDLVRAHRRGVSVQVLVNRRDAKDSAPYRRLRAGLKKHRNQSAPTPGSGPSYVRTCKASCRGVGGFQHAKIYLFSRVGRVRWVSMVSSANLTRFAAVGQWNHLDTLVGKREYTALLGQFAKLRRDRPGNAEEFATPKLHAWTFPRKVVGVSDDPMAQELRRIRCLAPKKRGQARQRTVIRIAMYAWFDNRGNNLARVVRRKWEQGCQVAVIYAVINGEVTAILRNRHGRGAIPMRRSVTFAPDGEVADYNHSKYIAVRGVYAGKPARLVWTGSMNFTGLGLISDEILVRLRGNRVYRAYSANFDRVWHR